MILDITLQDGPITLCKADFILGKANINSISVQELICAKILKLGFKQICHSIFLQLCPGYSDQPHAALDHICQSLAGPNGQSVTSTVIEFYQCLMNASRPFQARRDYPVSICDIFIQKLDWPLLPLFRRHYLLYANSHQLDVTYQCQQLAIILAAAQAAKDEVHHVQDIARLLVSQGFFSVANGGVLVSAHPSQAENTLMKYSDGPTPPGKRPPVCWGCGRTHVWHKRGTGPIICPLKDNPKAIKHANVARKKFFEDRSRRRGGWNKEKSDANTGSNAKKRDFVEYKDMTEAQKTKMRKDVLAATLTSSLASFAGPSVFFIGSVPVLQSAPPARRILPVPVQTAFPHLILQLGLELGCSNCPAICCIVDTAAALTTGNFHFFAQITKAYLHTVAAIYSHADYSPIVLSGIVQKNGESVTTDLTVAFQFHMPYLTRESNASTLLVATGPHVTINAILGLPFIQQTCMII
jgi:hypothetical protein